MPDIEDMLRSLDTSDWADEACRIVAEICADMEADGPTRNDEPLCRFRQGSYTIRFTPRTESRGGLWRWARGVLPRVRRAFLGTNRR